MKTELKTLKDMIFYLRDRTERVDAKELKAEAIKWVKEDMKVALNQQGLGLIMRWMKRLDITKEDLI